MRRVLGHLLRALIAIVAILATSSPAEAAAPMCGEEAVSIEAPPPIYPNDDGVLSACGETLELDSHGLPVKSGETKLGSTSTLDLAILTESILVPAASSVAVPLERPLRTSTNAHLRDELRPPRS